MKKIHLPVERKLVEALGYILENKSSASRVIKHSFSTNKKWGARDRRTFAECFYDILRNYRAYAYPYAKSADEFKLPPEKLKTIVEDWRNGELDRTGIPEKIKFSASEDLYSKLKEEFSLSDVTSFLRNSYKRADVFLRVNTLKSNTKEVIKLLKEEEVEVEEVKENCLKLADRKNVFITEAFKKGFFEMQDGASQDVAPFLEVEPGHRVIDSCAGAGGKTLHIAALLKGKGKVIAMDIFEKRLEELKKRSRRAGVQNLEIKHISSTKLIKRLAGTADRLLLDVPCTGSGVYRRKPESKLFFSQEEHERLNTLQKEIIRSHSRMLKSGGKMVYATCSVLPSENMKVVEGFLKENKDFKLEEAVTNEVSQDGFDGFFMAKLIRE